MNRLLGLMLLILLALSLSAALGEGNRMFTLDADEYVIDMLACGDTLYIQTDERLYAWKAEEAEPVAWEGGLLLPEYGEADAEPSQCSLFDVRLYADGDGLHGLRIGHDEEGEPRGMQLFDLDFADGETLAGANVRELKLPESLRENIYWSLTGVCAADGSLILLGEGEIGATLSALDPEDPGAADTRTLGDWGARLIPAPEGPLLTEYAYEGEGDEWLALSRVRPDGTAEPVCRLSAQTRGLAADPSDGAVFGAMDGRACAVDLATGEGGAPFAALPLEPDRAAALDGIYAAIMGKRVALLDTSGTLAEDGLLTVSCRSSDDWLDEAAMEWSLQHPECTAVMIRDFKSADEILEAVLTRAPEPDVFMLDSGEAATRALRERGYALSLSDSRTLTELCGRVYPGVARCFLQDGAPVALPLDADCAGMGVSERLLERLGLRVADVPGDWMGFLDFLEDRVRPTLGDLGEKGFFTYEGMTAEGFRLSLMMRILCDYTYASDAAGVGTDYENPELVALLEHLDGMDFTEFGLPEGQEDEADGYSWSSDNDYLIQPDMDVRLNDNMHDGDALLVLDFGDDLPGVLALDVRLFFVNPFGAHPQESVAFLESVAQRLPEETLYMLCPDLNQPLRRQDMERESAEYEGRIASLRARLEGAEAAERQALEEELARLEEDYRNYLDRDSWLISRDRLDRYRASGERLTATVSGWFDRDASGEAAELLRQYAARRITAREFLTAVNQKARMMELEG